MFIRCWSGPPAPVRPLLLGLNQALDDDVNPFGLLLVDVQILDHLAFESDAADAAAAGFGDAQAQCAVQKIVEQGSSCRAQHRHGLGALVEKQVQGWVHCIIRSGPRQQMP